MSLLVRDAGLLSLLVDCGRPRTRHLGVPLGGAADRQALALGNALVGNEPDAVALEMTLAGPVIEAVHPQPASSSGHRSSPRSTAARFSAERRSPWSRAMSCASAAPSPAHAAIFAWLAGSMDRKCSAAVRRSNQSAVEIH